MNSCTALGRTSSRSPDSRGPHSAEASTDSGLDKVNDMENRLATVENGARDLVLTLGTPGVLPRETQNSTSPHFSRCHTHMFYVSLRLREETFAEFARRRLS